MVDTSDAWIIERTGIKERHILKGEGLGTSYMAAEAVRGLLQKTGTKPVVPSPLCADDPDMQSRPVI
jgi:3-oxoacyl-[acyl-carrier-protein] synthase-3